MKRSHYWLAFVLVGSLGAANVNGFLRSAPSEITIAALSIMAFAATVMRLRDTGWSAWWAMLFFFPASIVWDVFSFRIGTANWHLIDISAIIRFFPVVIGLLAASRLVPEKDHLKNIFA